MSNPADYIEPILTFIRQSGIGVQAETIDEPTFLPGILIRKGQLIYDPEKLSYPGDLLHEAGHIAVCEPEKREQLSDNVLESGSSDGEEVAAILWSYAASVKISLPDEVLFHPDGYKGQSDWFIENFQNKTYIGLPLLQWMGMAYDSETAERNHQPAYPEMLRWLR